MTIRHSAIVLAMFAALSGSSAKADEGHSTTMQSIVHGRHVTTMHDLLRRTPAPAPSADRPAHRRMPSDEQPGPIRHVPVLTVG